jgi:PTS system ascorbate-specific IIA component
LSVGILMMTHQPCGADLLRVATAILGARPPGVEAMEVVNDVPREVVTAEAAERLERLDTGEGVLILTDLYGSTPANVAVSLLAIHERSRVIAGLNLPMLLRALTYVSLDLDAVTEKALQGGRDGVLLCSRRDDRT